jgi:hypothetical protein
VELQGEWRCIHCNKVFEEERRLERHGRTCEYKPPPRPRNSVVGRMATAAWEDGLQDVYPTITRRHRICGCHAVGYCTLQLLGQPYDTSTTPYQRDMLVAQPRTFRRQDAGGSPGFAP